ncbi:prolyl-tRNA synthetase [Metarhizium rileyi]|uniref:proline--tRNA ligase n=1 Tax=Metarhizium rileyi (strain RCEF 4871) TaxID=1649241 RepID=A0A167B5E4_METRR|nr:prolyl-tRNA synthetase [Metarhizium rileyi RCEF 4871]
MAATGASRLSLSTITSEELWRRSGRLDRVSSELFRLTDRKQTPMMLSPTHEEEITTLVASTLKSYRDLPLRLYQTTRKYRDEMRPRHGLLRSREFIMKDLYTFDTSFQSAINTYKDVSQAYRAFFADMKIPIMVAEASSGDMGGDYSHEYHLANPIGEDTVISCDSCGYTANDEVATARPSACSHQASAPQTITQESIRVWRGVTRDCTTLVNAWYPTQTSQGADSEINLHAIKKIIPELDTSINNPVRSWEDAATIRNEGKNRQRQIINVVDFRLDPTFHQVREGLSLVPDSTPHTEKISQSDVTRSEEGERLNLLRLVEGDGCPRCEPGSLRIHRALELGHTFYLGARYSTPFELLVTLPNSEAPVPVEMGCYGIGVSRIFGAVAEHKADAQGLNWPRAIAPFEVVVIPTSGVDSKALELYDKLTSWSSSGPGFDAVLDDRKESFGWKMQDADLIGYPVTIVLGKAWREKDMCEVQCRSLSSKENVAAEHLPTHLNELLSQL